MGPIRQFQIVFVLLALNFIIGFFVTRCEIMQKWQEV